MEPVRLHNDFREFLKLLNSKGIEYLVVGGHAVGLYGYPRTTGDMDVWCNRTEGNALKLVDILHKFGFSDPAIRVDLFLTEEKIIRMGLPPVRIEILTSISGVAFEDCYARKHVETVMGIEVNFISLDDLMTNKKAAGRLKDLDDLEHLGLAGDCETPDDN